jgi:acyl-CoA hydrolase
MRIVSPAEAVASIESGQQIWIQDAAATPSVLLQALVDRADELENVRIAHFHIEGPAPHLAPDMVGHFIHKALFIGPNARQAVNEGRAQYIPVFLSDVPELFTSGVMPLDAILLNVSRPDRHGFCSLGTSVLANLAGVRAATTVIAQLNDQMPRTMGDSCIHVSQIDWATEVSQPPYEYREPAIGEVEKRIGEHIAELVPDGATLQLGIGAIPSAAALALVDKHDLGIHTEMFTDAILPLIDCGAITGAAKEINRLHAR